MNRTVFEKYDGSEEEVIVDFWENGEAVTCIGAKAFLSCKSIKKLEIASSVTEIGDWAFAHMQNLQVLILPRQELMMGKKVFLDCEKLMQIQIREDKSDNPGTPWFLASAVSVLKKEKLCKPEMAGDFAQHREWMKDYDRTLLSFLAESDEEGFEPVFIGWFRVEDIDEQIPRYQAKKRREKAQLVLQRLLYPAYLEDDTIETLEAYMREHLPEADCKKEHTSMYSFLCEECGRDIRYFKILKERGFLSIWLVEKFLQQIQEPSAEVTAFLLREKAEKGEKNFFEDFDFNT